MRSEVSVILFFFSKSSAASLISGTRRKTMTLPSVLALSYNLHCAKRMVKEPFRKIIKIYPLLGLSVNETADWLEILIS